MKILVSTKKTQGQRDNDFCFPQEGELVYPSWTCTSGSADDECGCRRCLTGVECGKGTTTVVVIDSPMTPDNYEAVVDASLRAAFGRTPKDFAGGLQEKVKQGAVDLLKRVAKYKVGDVLEYRSGRLFVRKAAAAAME